MTKREIIHSELKALTKEGAKLCQDFHKNKDTEFRANYQRWYTKALKATASVAPDRYVEFRNYYEIDPKRKSLGFGTYVIQDFLKNVAPNKLHFPDFDTRKQVFYCFLNQITILDAIDERVDTVIANIEGELYSELQDNEIAVAKLLAKINLRSAGALVGVLIEGHLQKVALAHGVKFTKKNPTIADMNDPLKAASVIDTPTWRKISFLADIRNICCHKKDVEPTKEQVDDLIQGAEWLSKNVF